MVAIIMGRSDPFFYVTGKAVEMEQQIRNEERRRVREEWARQVAPLKQRLGLAIVQKNHQLRRELERKIGEMNRSLEMQLSLIC